MPIPAEGLRGQRICRRAAIIRVGCCVLPNGDVLVAETDNPGTDKTGGTISGKIQKMLMKKAGSGKPSANRISLLRDADGDGVAEVKIALVDRPLFAVRNGVVGNGELFVANADGIVAFPFHAGPDAASPPSRATSPTLPSGYNHHWTKSMVASPDGKLSLCRRRIEQQCRRKRHGDGEGPRRDPARSIRRPATWRIFAGGLRNPVGLAWNPWSGALWTAVNERDELGSDLVPDY